MIRAKDRGTPSEGDAELVSAQEVSRALPASLEETVRLARGYFEAARAENTTSAYDSDLRDFATWCKVEAGGLSPIPASPETVALYITDLTAGQGLKASTAPLSADGPPLRAGGGVVQEQPGRLPGALSGRLDSSGRRGVETSGGSTRRGRA